MKSYRRMKYHRWKIENGYAVCTKCGVGIGEKVRPRRVAACPPTPFEKQIIERINYGDYGKYGSFDGLHALIEG